MPIANESGDAHEFIAIATRIVGDVIREYAPANLLLIKTDNWFGRKWLGFAGKTIGAVGVWNDAHIIPPFVPGRVLSQRKYEAPLYQEIYGGEPIHLRIPSESALTRKASAIAPNAALLWYSGNSASNGRGCIMAYIPEGEDYKSWYAGWVKGEKWELAETAGITPNELVWEQSHLLPLEQ